MVSSGLTAKATVDDSAVEVIPHSPSGNWDSVTIVNEGGVLGFFSLDNGNSWCRLTATTVILDKTQVYSVLVKRIAAGTNLSGIFAYVWNRS